MECFLTFSNFDYDLANYNLMKDGYTIVPIENNKIISELKDLLNSSFKKNQTYYDNLMRTDWHNLVLKVQNKIEERGILQNLINSQNKHLLRILQINSKKLGWVNVLKLRAVRPYNPEKIPDHVPFHRETIYASTTSVRYQYNYWTPISTSANKSGLRIIPNSHMILDEALVTEKIENHESAVKKFSSGHAIGYPYAPKLIKNLALDSINKEKLINVPEGYSLLFSSMLIHGNGINKTANTRFSVDTGFIPEEYLYDNKPLFAAKNRLHYELN